MNPEFSPLLFLSLLALSMSLLTPFRVIVCSINSNVTHEHEHMYVCMHAYTTFTEPCSVVLKKAYLQMTTLDWINYERPSACRRLNIPPQQQLIPCVSLPTDASVWKCPSPHWSVDWCVHYMGFDKVNILLKFPGYSFSVTSRSYSLETDVLVFWILQFF